MNIDERALFSSDPSTRWEEASKWAQPRGWTKKKNTELRLKISTGDLADISASDVDLLSEIPPGYDARVQDWGEEFALCGSLNAWMTFIGPSPGGSPSHNSRMHALLDSSAHHRNPVLGRPHPSLWYVDGAGFFDEVRKWAHGAYESAGYFRKTKDEFGSLASFLMLNLVKKAYDRESDIPIKLRRKGAERMWGVVMPVVRPKLVVALTRSEPQAGKTSNCGVYRILVTEAERLGLQTNELPQSRFQSGKNVYKLPKALIESSDWGRVLLVTVPTHPSYFQSWIKGGRINARSDVTEYLGRCIDEAMSHQ